MTTKLLFLKSEDVAVVLELALVSMGLTLSFSYPKSEFVKRREAVLEISNSALLSLNLISSNKSSVHALVFCDLNKEPRRGCVVTVVLVAISVSPSLDAQIS